MHIHLTSDDVVLAVKEFLARRGVPGDLSIDILIRGGRNGNNGTVHAEIVPNVGPDIEAPPVFAGMFTVPEPEEDTSEKLEAPETVAVEEPESMQVEMDFEAPVAPEEVIEPIKEDVVEETPKKQLKSIFMPIEDEEDDEDQEEEAKELNFNPPNPFLKNG